MAGLRIKGYCFGKNVGLTVFQPIYQIRASANTNLRITELKVTFDDLTSAPLHVRLTLDTDPGTGGSASTLNKIVDGHPGTIQATAREGTFTANPIVGTVLERQYSGPGGYVELHDYCDLLAAGKYLTVWVKSNDTGSDDQCAVSFKGEE